MGRCYEPEPLFLIDKILVLLWVVSLGGCFYFKFQDSFIPCLFCLILLSLIPIVAILRGII